LNRVDRVEADPIDDSTISLMSGELSGEERRNPKGDEAFRENL